MRSTISFRDGYWQKIVSKNGEIMWLIVKDKFEVLGSVRERVLQALVISTMQRLFRAWKIRLTSHYSRHIADRIILSHRPEDVELEDWKYLVEYFGSSEFKKNPATGEKETPDRVWEIQYIHKNDNGEIVWVDPQSQQIHGQLQELVAQQQSEENEHPMTRDEILSFVLGERTSYVHSKGYRKNPPKKSHIQAANLEANVSSAMATVRQKMQAEMQAEMSRKL
ncbi:uncharacterized protein LOC107806906 isoform X3 [Nicotiana tabacum]|uniref:Uncharacterized protein LOC107806906 isoform X3 n=2 Tax=Nicotiana tabacum TaxID=4097 RepID=A0AC58SS55_TOBAC